MEDGGAERGTRNEETLVQVNQCFLARARMQTSCTSSAGRDLGETPDPDCLQRHWSYYLGRVVGRLERWRCNKFALCASACPTCSLVLKSANMAAQAADGVANLKCMQRLHPRTDCN
jgi:hypothetical protein